ncbi:hypothetical protein FBEOM_14716 [Fusarium beomiforme]|uniref:Uncharacterized protein n=1 Tax=Fusarium beomiforme TaxID=44412 RepID=A0A9P5A2N4_9HYPO|nr:hypothetical protein FBEOM_14716 [Fusarium beomiforme]
MQRRAASTALALDTGKEKSRMFLRRETKWGETYYVINRWPEAPKLPDEREYFQINDLLLDLDDMFSKHVRLSSEEDEERALKKWSRDNKRESIQRKLHHMETSLAWSRMKAFEISSRPSNSWRLGSHDIFSAALRAPSPAPLIGSSKNQKGSANATAETKHNTLHLISSNNGISKQVLDDDSLLLRWFQSRTQLSWSGKYSGASRNHSVQLSEALKEQDRLTSVRRLVSQYLSFEPSEISFHQPRGHEQEQSTQDLSSELRKAFENLLKQGLPQEKHEILVFLGNLCQRLPARGDHLGGALCGLGLRLSAEIFKPAATKRYLQIGFKNGYWTDDDQGSIDILHCFETYRRHFNNVSRPNSLDLNGRQELLELLLGPNMEEKHFVLYLIKACLRESKQNIAFDAYRAFIILLGHLGTVELLEREQKTLSAMIQRLASRETLKDKKRRLELT